MRRLLIVALLLLPLAACAQAPVTSVVVAPTPGAACAPSEAGRVSVQKDSGAAYCCTGSPSPTWQACSLTTAGTTGQIQTKATGGGLAGYAGSSCASGVVTGLDIYGVPTCTTTIPGSLISGAVASATSATSAGALAADPTDCSGNNFAKGVNASGTAACAQPAFSNLSGAASAAQIPVATAAALGGVKGTGTALLCPGGQAAVGFDAAGALQCATATSAASGSTGQVQIKAVDGTLAGYAGSSCASGVATGIDIYGVPVCSTTINGAWINSAVANATNATNADTVDSKHAADFVPKAGASYVQSAGLSSSWGVTSGANTGGFNTIMGTSGSATWLLSGTSGGVFRGGVQMLDAGGAMRIYAGSYYLTVDQYPDINGNTIWHTGNDGAGSGLDADTVDGVHASPLLPYEIAVFIPGKPSTGGKVLYLVFSRTVTGLDLYASRAQTNATASASFTVQGCPQALGACGSGTFTFAAGSGAATKGAWGVPTDYAAGDTLMITAPATQDASLADVAITLKGTKG